MLGDKRCRQAYHTMHGLSSFKRQTLRVSETLRVLTISVSLFFSS